MADSVVSAVESFSEGLAAAVEKASPAIVLVDARRRFPATGIVWRAGGIIVTADHVLERDQGITVTLAGGSPVPATIVGREAGCDIAVLKIEGETAPGEMASSFRVGELVLALGRPEQSVMASLGVISTLGGAWETATGVQIDGFLRSDTTFYPGFSGGPLVNVKGEIVGMNSSMLGRGGGLTLPAASVDKVVQALIEHGRVRRGFLGVTSQPVEAAAGSGLLVVSVAGGSPAASAGILVGDIITSFDGNNVDSSTDLRRHLGSDSIDRTVPIGIIRGGDAKTVTVKIGERTARE